MRPSRRCDYVGRVAVGVHGVVSSSNSLVGSTEQDLILARVSHFATATGWSEVRAGQTTLRQAWVPRPGSMPAHRSWARLTANSLVGTTAYDAVGTSIAALNDGRYVVASPDWNSGGVSHAGAVTWVDPTGSRSGIVSADNSLVGFSANDAVDRTLPYFSMETISY